MPGHVLIIRLNKQGVDQTGGVNERARRAAAHQSSLLLAAQSHRERKKSKAAHSPQDRDRYGSHRYAHQHDTYDQNENYSVKHG
jgi:hypothetical protein